MPQFQSFGLLTSNILESLKDSIDLVNANGVTKLQFIVYECYRCDIFILFIMSNSPSPWQGIMWDKQWT
jgi:hypothetical protein